LAFADDPGDRGKFFADAVMAALADGGTEALKMRFNQFCVLRQTSLRFFETLRLTLCDLEAKTASPLISEENAEPAFGLKT
jgi:hypothetical protein